VLREKSTTINPLPEMARNHASFGHENVQKPPPAHDYNDYVAQLFSKCDATSEEKNELEGTPWPDCAKYAITGECENGHTMAKVLLCGKEYCPTCGADGSWAHQRRQGLLLKRVRQMLEMGYFVVELPDDSRGKYRSKQALVRLRRLIVKALKQCGYYRGVSRFHHYGEKRPGKWNPHLNVLVDGGYISRRKLDRIKSMLRQVTGESKLIVHYSFTNEVPKMRHIVRYVTRATFLDESWDYQMAAELYGFRNITAWGPRGSWDQEPVWGFDADTIEGKQISTVERLESGVCHKCGKPIVWGEVVPVSLIVALGGVHVGGGYFEFQDVGPPPDRLNTDDLSNVQDWLDSVKVVARNMAENRQERNVAIAQYESWKSRRVRKGSVKRLYEKLARVN